MSDSILSIRVTYQQIVGFIPFTVSCGDQSVTLCASELYDPFPSMIQWLEAITTGVNLCSFWMDEEGPEAKLIMEQQWNGAYLTICNRYDDEQVHLYAQVDPVQVVAELYNNLRTFAKSPEYNRSNWEPMYLAERLANITDPPTEIAVIEESLLGYSREELQNALFKASPNYVIKFPDVDDDIEHWEKTVGYMSDQNNPEKSKGLIKEPVEWHVEEEYDQMQYEQRLKIIRELLACKVEHFDGCRLAEIHSSRVEEWLKEHYKTRSDNVVSLSDRKK